MDSHEARALLRHRGDTGLHSPAYLAQGVLIADIHEWLEELAPMIRRAHDQRIPECMRPVDYGETADALDAELKAAGFDPEED